MDRSTRLDELQSLDMRIEECRLAQKQLEARLADDSALDAARRAFESTARQEHDLRARLSDLDLEVKGLEEQIRGVDSRLYSGHVTNAKELTGLERDEKMLKRHKSQVEDQMLDLMAQLEKAEADAAAQRLALDAVTGTHDLAGRQDRARLDQLQSSAAGWAREREELRARMNPADLQIYDGLSAAKKGRAVAHIKNSSCAACGFAIPSGLASRARVGQELVFCVNCGRILIPG